MVTPTTALFPRFTKLITIIYLLAFDGSNSYKFSFLLISIDLIKLTHVKNSSKSSKNKHNNAIYIFFQPDRCDLETLMFQSGA